MSQEITKIVVPGIGTIGDFSEQTLTQIFPGGISENFNDEYLNYINTYYRTVREHPKNTRGSVNNQYSYIVTEESTCEAYQVNYSADVTFHRLFARLTFWPKNLNFNLVHVIYICQNYPEQVMNQSGKETYFCFLNETDGLPRINDIAKITSTNEGLAISSPIDTKQWYKENQNLVIPLSLKNPRIIIPKLDKDIEQVF